MRGECPKLLRKLKKEKHHKSKAMVATWSDEELGTSSSSSEDQIDNLCLMAHESNTCEVNSDLESISNEQWEEAYELLYEKFKNLK